MPDTTWMGRKIVAPEDHDYLERLAAIREFVGKLPRDQAEAAAYREYARKQHVRSAAHHLAGMNTAKAAGKAEEGKKHFSMYAAHMGALGHDPYGPVPKEIEAAANKRDEKDPNLYAFQAHPGDDLMFEAPPQKK